MLRYFYFLCLLVCIRLTFCYEYISDQEHYNPRRARKDTRLRHRRVKENGMRYNKRHDYDAAEDKDPVAEIDVASFIEKPDYDAIDENGPYMPLYKKRERISKEYNDYGSIPGVNLDANMEKRSQDYINQGINNLNEKQYPYKNNMLNPRHSNMNSMYLEGMDKKNDNLEGMAKSYPNEFLIDKSRTHKPVKKCPLKQMKIPFFFRKKTGTTKAKKMKKRRLFCFNCGNKSKESASSTPPVIDPTLNLNKSPYKISKRSYTEIICPVCGRKYSAESEELNTRKRRTSSRMIHNSRQFYQELSSSKYKPKKDIPLHDVNHLLDEDNDDTEERRKRYSIDEKDRQLKEIDEVQRKIDSVDIISANSSKGNSNIS